MALVETRGALVTIPWAAVGGRDGRGVSNRTHVVVAGIPGAVAELQKRLLINHLHLR